MYKHTRNIEICLSLDSSGLLCTSDKKIYVPSPFELEEYCRQRAHRKCPFFKAGGHSRSTAHPADHPGTGGIAAKKAY